MDLRRLVLLAVSLRSMVIVAVLLLVGAHYLLSSILFTPSTVGELKEQLKENKNIDINERNDDGYTALQMAVSTGDYDRAKVLLDFGADVDSKDTHVDDRPSFRGNTALHLACWMGNADRAIPIIQLLLDNDADVYARNDNNDTPLLRIVDISNVTLDRRETIMKMLLDYGADINAQDKDGNTIIHLCVDRIDGAFIQYMQDNFGSLINWNVKNNQGKTPREWADYKGFGFLVDNVLSRPIVVIGADDNVAATDQFGRTGLMLAILRNDYEFARNQIKLGSNVNATSHDALGMRPIHYACWVEKPLAYVDMLLSMSQVELNVGNKKFGDTPLHIAIYISNEYDRTQVMNLLLKAGANVYAQNYVGDTPMHAAVRAHATRAVALLKEKYTYDINNKDGYSPLELAKKLKYQDIVDILSSPKRTQ